MRPDRYALRDALVALAQFREQNPVHAAWIADGAPALTEAEHVERFGCAYVSPRARKAAR